MLNSAVIPLVRVPVQRKYDEAELRRRVLGGLEEWGIDLGR